MIHANGFPLAVMEPRTRLATVVFKRREAQRTTGREGCSRYGGGVGLFVVMVWVVHATTTEKGMSLQRSIKGGAGGMGVGCTPANARPSITSAAKREAVAHARRLTPTCA